MVILPLYYLWPPPQPFSMQVVNYNYGILSSHYTGVPTHFYIYVYVCARRTWKPTPIFLPEESHGQRNLEDYGLWHHKVSDMTEQLSTSQHKLPWRSSPVAQEVNNLFAMQKRRVQFLGWIDDLEKGLATHSGIPAWTSSRTEEPGGLQSMGLKWVGHDWAMTLLPSN